MLLISQAEVDRLLDARELIAALARAFVDYSAGRCDVPARVAARTASGLLGAMPGYVPGFGLAAKLVAVFPHADPSHQALIALFDESDGRPLAVMDGARITALRTAAASAVAVDALARKDAAVLAIAGMGVQGRAHREVVPLVRNFRDVRTWSRSTGGSLQKILEGADVVCLCTDSPTPIVEASWLSRGCVVTSVGIRAEVGPDLVNAASVFVEWRGAATQKPPAGAIELQGAQVTELGELLAGKRPEKAGQVMLYKSTGLALEDTVAAALVYRRALAQKAGTQVSS